MPGHWRCAPGGACSFLNTGLSVSCRASSSCEEPAKILASSPRLSTLNRHARLKVHIPKTHEFLYSLQFLDWFEEQSTRTVKTIPRGWYFLLLGAVLAKGIAAFG